MALPARKFYLHFAFLHLGDLADMATAGDDFIPLLHGIDFLTKPLHRLLLRAEQAGFDSTLLAEHVIHPSDTEDDVLETWSTIAALAERFAQRMVERGR